MALHVSRDCIDIPSEFHKRLEILENQELQSSGSIASAQVYGELLSLYLLFSDMSNAKFLWKRIPQHVKLAHPDIEMIWNIGKLMWIRDIPAIYPALSQDWSENLAPIMALLTETTRLRALTLVANAYSSISTTDFAANVGLSVNEAIELSRKQGWQVNDNMIRPLKPAVKLHGGIPSEKHLATLTELVSYLEN